MEPSELPTPEVIRRVLEEFWAETLEVAATPAGLSLAIPLCYPDGWQILLDLRPLTPGVVRLSDSGRTLHGLAGGGQNIEAARIKELLIERAEAFHIQRDGWELYRDARLPLAGMDIHLFAEGLADISRLCNLYEATPKTRNVVRETVERVFQERAIPVQQGIRLDGKLEKHIQVDYFARMNRPIAMEVISRRDNITPFMEQWGFRWRDLCDLTPNLLPAMIFDPAVSELDETALSIGNSVCELFCAYDETNRINAFLESAGR
jgi:uncharacterized protein YjhX (UPF0386 family)